MFIVISGPGGVGKGTVVARLIERAPSLTLSRSWTTRQRRPGEAAEAYTFVDRETFERHINEGGFLEHAEFLGHLYGTPYPDLDASHDVILEIDVQGARQVHERDNDALLIFLTAPSTSVQQQRLRGRGDTTDQIERRIVHTAHEIADGERLDAKFVVNDVLDDSVDQILALIAEARPSRSPQPPSQPPSPPPS